MRADSASFGVVRDRRSCLSISDSRHFVRDSAGTFGAVPERMRGAKSCEDLDVYKLAVELRRLILELTERQPVCRDYRFVAQIRDAARGAPRNVAEGFSRFAPGEFRQFLSYAKASVDETAAHVRDGHECRYFSDPEYDQLVTLTRRTSAAIRGLMRYLESPAAKSAYESLVHAREREAARRYPTDSTSDGPAPQTRDKKR